MKPIKLSRIVAAMLVAAVMLACNSDKYTAAAKTANVAAGSIKTICDIKRTAAAAGEIGPADELAVTRVLKEVNGALLQCAEAAAKIESFTGDAKAALVQQCADVSDRITRLQSDGVLRVKSEKSKRKLSNALAALAVATEGVSTAVALIPDSTARAAPPEGRTLLARAVDTLRANDTLLDADISRLSAVPN
jgi:hypothetical protein